MCAVLAPAIYIYNAFARSDECATLAVTIVKRARFEEVVERGDFEIAGDVHARSNLPTVRR